MLTSSHKPIIIKSSYCYIDARLVYFIKIIFNKNIQTYLELLLKGMNLMRKLTTYEILREELTRGIITKYSVTQFCKATGMSRGVFYNTYTGLTDLFCKSIQAEIKTHFREYGVCQSNKLIFAFLRQIGNDRLFYTNIYHLTRKKHTTHICDQINRTLFTEMQKHLFNSDYSNKHIKSMTNILLAHITNWIDHGCDAHVLDVYTDVAIILPKPKDC